MRTCLLCGKQLSRIWVGAGDEFCSREHRNQYRLRRGMDRLLEANKVASLMRRRENPKPVPGAQLLSQYAVSPRGFFDVKFSITPSTKRTLPLSLQRVVLLTPRISSRAESFLNLRPAGATSTKQAARPATARPEAFLHLTPLALRTSQWKPKVEVRQAAAAWRRDSVSSSGGLRRDFGILRQHSLRIHLGRTPVKLAVADDSKSRYAHMAHCTRIPRPEALPGIALRVSSSAGFRLAKPATFPRRALALQAMLRWPERTLDPSRCSLSQLGSMRPAHVPMWSLGGLRYPASHGLPATAFQWPGFVTLATQMQEAVSAVRVSDSQWSGFTVMAPCHLEPWPPLSGTLSREPGDMRLFELVAQTPTSISQGAHRLSLVPFDPQDSPFASSPISIHGAIEHVGLSVAPEPVAPERIEENFASGWDNWIGGVDDWKVDAAGVRTGAMALFTPTMHMEDYQLDFFARIEHKSITWLFRAADFNQYYRASIAIVPSGGYEFSRHAVGVQPGPGAPPPAVAVPFRLAAAAGKTTAKAAFTVRTRVRDNEFSVSVDGQTIDTWTDPRIPQGGIGFVATPDDRARLYWVRISSEVTSSKEFGK